MARLGNSRWWRAAGAEIVLAAMIFPSPLAARDEPTIEELKARVANASAADRPPLCIRIAERQLDTADRFYVADDIEKAQAPLTDVTTFAKLARDYAIQSHKHEKQAEIAIRKMVRKLENMKHIIARDDQEPVQKTIERLEQIRDNLLAAMFQKGDKK